MVSKHAAIDLEVFFCIIDIYRSPYLTSTRSNRVWPLGAASVSRGHRPLTLRVSLRHPGGGHIASQRSSAVCQQRSLTRIDRHEASQPQSTGTDITRLAQDDLWIYCRSKGTPNPDWSIPVRGANQTKDTTHSVNVLVDRVLRMFSPESHAHLNPPTRA